MAIVVTLIAIVGGSIGSGVVSGGRSCGFVVGGVISFMRMHHFYRNVHSEGAPKAVLAGSSLKEKDRSVIVTAGMEDKKRTDLGRFTEKILAIPLGSNKEAFAKEPLIS